MLLNEIKVKELGNQRKLLQKERRARRVSKLVMALLLVKKLQIWETRERKNFRGM